MNALPTYRAALKRAMHAVEPLGERETVDLAQATGRVLATSIVADRDLPPFDRAAMDGYALRSAELGVVESFAVAGEIAAGQAASPTVAAGACVKISTGAAVPAPFDAVVQHELSDRGNPVRFMLDAVDPGRNIHRRGADARASDRLIEAGTLLGSHHIGIAAAVGCASLDVARRPRAIVLSTGNEVRPIGASVEPHEIRDSNSPMVAELLRRFGAEVIDRRHVLDDADAVHAAVERSLDRADLLVTIGGISAGEHDHLPEAFAAHGFDLVVRGAAIQPGKPIIIGVHASGQFVVGLPGNPVSSLVCAHLFALPIVRRLLGLTPEPQWREVEIAEPVQPNERRQAFRPAAVLDTSGVRIPPWAGSGDLIHTARTDGIVELPQRREAVEVGERLQFLPFH